MTAAQEHVEFVQNLYSLKKKLKGDHHKRLHKLNMKSTSCFEAHGAAEDQTRFAFRQRKSATFYNLRFIHCLQTLNLIVK